MYLRNSMKFKVFTLCKVDYVTMLKFKFQIFILISNRVICRPFCECVDTVYTTTIAFCLLLEGSTLEGIQTFCFVSKTSMSSGCETAHLIFTNSTSFNSWN